MAVQSESHRRSIVKSMTFRIVAISVTMLVSYFWLHEWRESITLAPVANRTRAVLYYLHKRVWNRTSFDRQKEIPEDYMI